MLARRQYIRHRAAPEALFVNRHVDESPDGALLSVKDLFEKSPPDVRKLRKQATAELRKLQRKQWKEKNIQKKTTGAIGAIGAIGDL